MSTLRWRIILPSLLLPWYGAMAASPPGQLVWWGHNPWGETTVTASSALASGFVTIGGQVLSNVVAVAGGGDQALALRSDGTVICGGGGRGGVRAGLTNVVAISTSGTVSLALKRDGSVVVWGDGSQNLPSAPDLADVVAVSAGAGHCLALTRDGTVVAWGNPWRKPGLVRGVPAGLSNVVAIAATHSAYGRDLALKSDGSVVEWSLRGSIQVGPLGPTVTNEVGEVGELVKLAELRVVEDLSDVAAVAAAEDSGMFGGVWFNLALKRDGTVFGWQANGAGEATGVPTEAFPHIGSGPVMLNGQALRDVVAIAAGRWGLALKRDGTVVSWGGGPRHSMSPPFGLTNVVAITAGKNFCLAITTQGSSP